MLRGLKQWLARREREATLPISAQQPNVPVHSTRFTGRWDAMRQSRIARGLPVSGYIRSVLRRKLRGLC